MTFNFVNLASGSRLVGIKKTFSAAAQDATKREDYIPVSLPTIGGITYSYLSGQLVRNGIALPPRER